MLSRAITVRDFKGAQAQAELAYCEECNGNQFHVFQLAGQDHSHFQCVSCGTSYCPGGRCDDPSVVAILATEAGRG